MKHLDKKSYHLLIHKLKEIPFNTLFAEAVLKNETNGDVYVDEKENPESFYIVHQYGMSLLFGDCNNTKFNENFRDYALNKYKVRNFGEYMQVYPFDWEDALGEIFKGEIIAGLPLVYDTDKICKVTRVNFRFDPEKYSPFNPSCISFKIERSDETDFNMFKGKVTPVRFFKDSCDFLKRGIGFTLKKNGKPISIAFSSFITRNRLELGMETIEEERKKGYALIVCSHLIGYCLENGYEPVWACMLENRPSYNLALKLGFVEDKRLPYYILPL